MPFGGRLKPPPTRPDFRWEGSYTAISYVFNLETQENEGPFEILRRVAETMNIHRPEMVSVPLPEFD